MPTNVGIAKIEPKRGKSRSGRKLVKEAREDGDISEEDHGFLFTSTQFKFNRIVEGVEEEIKSGWIGGTTIAEMSSEGAFEGTAVLMLIESDEIDFTSFKSSKISDDSQKAAEEVSGKVESLTEEDDRNEIIFSLIPGLTLEKDGREFKFLEGLERKMDEDMSIVGGSTGDGKRLVENYQMKDGEVYADRAVITLIQTDHDIVTGQAHGFDKEIATGIVTETDGRVVKEISGEPAIEFYSRRTGVSEEELSKIYNTDLRAELMAGIRYLELKLRGKDPNMVHRIFNHSLDYSIAREIKPGEYRLVSPIEVVDKGVKMIDKVHEEETIKILEADRKSVVNAPKKAFSDVKREKAVFGVLADCASRHMLLDDDEKENEVRRAAEKIGDNFIGFYGEGEIGGGGTGLCTYMSQTITGFAIQRPE